MEPHEIASRAGKIRLSRKELARRAKLNPNTISRVLRGRQDPYRLTHAAIERELIEEERALLEHLNTVHGTAAVKAEAA